MQTPGFLSEENKLDQRRCNFAFFSLKIFDENTIAKLIYDLRRNFSNRFSQSTFPEFNAFSNFTISIIFWNICKQFA